MLKMMANAKCDMYLYSNLGKRPLLAFAMEVLAATASVPTVVISPVIAS